MEFADQPMSHHPHDQLLLQIRGAVAEYERSLIGSPHATRPTAEVPGRRFTAMDSPTLWLSSRPSPSA